MQKERSYFATLIEIFLISTKLGLTSFGGPVAHLGYFHEEYVKRRKWLDEKSYANLVALCQFLPGPASSQVGIGIGVIRGGLMGGIISFLGFTFPSAVALILFAVIVKSIDTTDTGWIHGLKVVAVAVVAHAIIGMAQKLTPDLKRKTISLFALIITLLWQTAFTQVGVIIIAGIIGLFLFKQYDESSRGGVNFSISRTVGSVCLSLFLILLLILPIISKATSMGWLTMFDSFYRSGALVFGGGHVVLPLLEQEFVPTGVLGEEAFLAGYGAAQAVPGPLFTFAAYLGAVISGWKGGLIATIAIFLPSFLLLFGTLPFWDKLRSYPKINGAFMGVNSAVVGILVSAFYEPIWQSSILAPIDFTFAAVLYTMLVFWKLPPWVIVLTGALGGLVIS